MLAVYPKMSLAQDTVTFIRGEETSALQVVCPEFSQVTCEELSGVAQNFHMIA